MLDGASITIDNLPAVDMSGVAWHEEAKETSKLYLPVLLDDPSFAVPVNAALFDKDGKADLVWSRAKRDAA